MANLDWVAVVSLVVSALAFFRPEFSKGLTRLIGGIEFYPPARIEIGYSNFGPVIAVGGSLRSKYGTIFLRTASLKVTRQFDKTTHELLWKAFRKVNLLDPSKSEIEVPTALAIDETQARRVEIVFSDEETVARLVPFVKKLNSDFIQAANAKWTPWPNINSKEFQDFAEIFRAANNQGSLKVFMKVQDEFYWREGAYELTVQFFLGDRKKPNKYLFKFVLSDEDEKNLRLNFTKIIDDQIGKTGTIYTFAYPQLMA